MSNDNKATFVRECDITKLKPYAQNPRKNEDAVEVVAKSIAEYGFINPIIVDEDFNICAGHTRYKAAMQQGIQKVPVIIAPQLSDPQLFAGFNIADNQTASVAEWDTEELATIIQGLQDDGADIAALGFDAEEFNEIMASIDGPPVNPNDPDDVPEPPVDPITKPGDLWVLGDHRLLCGDAKIGDDVRRLGIENCRSVVTSPPYFNQREYSQWKTYAAYLADMGMVLKLFPDPILVCWNVGDSAPEHLDIPADHSVLMSELGFKYIDKIAWRKPRAVFDCPRNGHIIKGRYYPAFAWEPILIFRKGDHPTFDMSDAKTLSADPLNVWDIETVRTNGGDHPAAFPVALADKLVRCYSKTGDGIYDPFVGSGTTIIACEQLGRRAFAMEIDPVYCDVAVRRWEQFTGKQAEILQDV